VGLAELFAHHAVPFLLVMFRLAGLLIFAPLLSSVMIPARVKTLLVFMFAAAIYPMIDPPALPATATIIDLAPLVLREALIGGVMGLIATLPILAMDMAGVIISQQMGFGLARVYNPLNDTDMDLLGQLLSFIALGLFIALGGLNLLFSTLIASFAHAPLGTLRADQTPLSLITATLGAGFELALRVSAPVGALIFLVLVAIGVLNKTMPQLNVMTIGFSIKILAGFLVFAASLTAVAHAGADEIAVTLESIIRWTHTLGAR
jgi:flagellar biosynthetic protein FliR